MRGVPLTPQDTEALARVYRETGNYERAGAAIGVSGSVAKRALRRRGESDRVALHAHALARGLREARRQLDSIARLVAKVAAEETGAGVSLEPKDLASLANTLARLSDSRIALADREDRRRTTRLTRAKLRAEIAQLAERDDTESGAITVVVRVAGDPPPVDPHGAAG
jgi:hypothetical protein